MKNGFYSVKSIKTVNSNQNIALLQNTKIQ